MPDEPIRKEWDSPRLPEQIETALAAFIAENEPPIAIAAAHGWRYQGKPGDKLIDLRRAINAAVRIDKRLEACPLCMSTNPLRRGLVHRRNCLAIQAWDIDDACTCHNPYSCKGSFHKRHDGEERRDE